MWISSAHFSSNCVVMLAINENEKCRDPGHYSLYILFQMQYLHFCTHSIQHVEHMKVTTKVLHTLYMYIMLPLKKNHILIIYYVMNHNV